MGTDTDGVECRKKVAGAISFLLSLQLGCVKVLHEALRACSVVW